MPLVAKGQKGLGKGKSNPIAEEEGEINKEEGEEEDKSFVLVSNIPPSWHTPHLR